MKHLEQFQLALEVLIEKLKTATEADDLNPMSELDVLFTRFGYPVDEKVFTASKEDIQVILKGINPLSPPFTIRERGKLKDYEILLLERIEQLDLDSLDSLNRSLIMTLKNPVIGTILTLTNGYILTANENTIFGFQVNDDEFEDNEVYFKPKFDYTTKEISFVQVKFENFDIDIEQEEEQLFYSLALISDDEMASYDDWYNEMVIEQITEKPTLLS